MESKLKAFLRLLLQKDLRGFKKKLGKLSLGSASKIGILFIDGTEDNAIR